jgi:hypothetical protein
VLSRPRTLHITWAAATDHRVLTAPLRHFSPQTAWGMCGHSHRDSIATRNAAYVCQPLSCIYKYGMLLNPCGPRPCDASPVHASLNYFEYACSQAFHLPCHQRQIQWVYPYEINAIVTPVNNPAIPVCSESIVIISYSRSAACICECL